MRWLFPRYLVGAIVVVAAVTTTVFSINAANQQGMTMSSTETAGGARMAPSVKANAFREILKYMGSREKPDPKLWEQFVAAQNDDLKTGPRIGEKVPDFTLDDHNGRAWSLSQLMGPQGLLLVFVRSADW
jgi:hypothetical protein